MKRITKILLLIVCINQGLLSTEIVVPDDYQYIQEAIDSAHTGDTVLIKPGLYEISSPIDLKEGVTLFGCSADSTILEGTLSVLNSNEPDTGSVIIARNNTQISFLQIRNGGSCGIYLRGPSVDINFANVSQNLIIDCDLGIKFDNRGQNGTIWIINNTIVNCTVGITDNDWGYIRMYNNLIANCESGVIKSIWIGSWIAEYNNVYNSAVSNWQGINPSGTNLSVDPLFSNISSGNYHLSPNSQCINTGNPDIDGYNLPVTDYYGNSRVLFDRIDIGVFEAEEYDPDNIDDGTASNYNIIIYPNPTNGVIQIDNTNSFTKINYEIYSPTGQLLQTDILTGDEIDLTHYSKGLYLLRLNTEDQTYIERILVE